MWLCTARPLYVFSRNRQLMNPLMSTAYCYRAYFQRIRLALASNSQGKHIHAIWSDFGEEMARVQGAVVVQRPDVTKVSDSIAPARTLDFVSTLQSYFPIFIASLLPRYGVGRCNYYHMSAKCVLNIDSCGFLRDRRYFCDVM